MKIFQSPYPDKIDSVRFYALCGYCLFQLAYALFILIYGLVRTELFDTLVPAALFTFPTIAIVFYFARKNYKLTTKVYVWISFVVQCTYLLGVQFSVGMNITSLSVFLILSILSFAVVSKKLGVIFFGLGIAAIVLNYFSKDGYPRTQMVMYDINGVFYHIAAYTICMFGFICCLLFLFEKYMKLYLSEITTTNELNTKLEESVDLLNTLNSNLEQHIRALSDANYKLTNYAWTHSHEVRAPVARILGLLNLVKIDKHLDKEFFTKTLLDTARELDDIILKMNRVLEEVNIESNEQGGTK